MTIQEAFEASTTDCVCLKPYTLNSLYLKEDSTQKPPTSALVRVDIWGDEKFYMPTLQELFDENWEPLSVAVKNNIDKLQDCMNEITHLYSVQSIYNNAKETKDLFELLWDKDTLESCPFPVEDYIKL